MAITSNRKIVIAFSGDQSFQLSPEAAANASAPNAQEIKTFTGAGDNTVTVPTGGTTPKGVTILPPAGNTAVLTLKGAAGDTGIPIHLTDPTSLGLATGAVSFILNVSATVTGIRFIWT